MLNLINCLIVLIKKLLTMLNSLAISHSTYLISNICHCKLAFLRRLFSRLGGDVSARFGSNPPEATDQDAQNFDEGKSLVLHGRDFLSFHEHPVALSDAIKPSSLKAV